ncbi:N-acetyltransferase [Lysobacter sp. CA196]|uniref:N-acetyltransferase n=1 Tax=Lysobacter sp. CA196 TaxID=3455606 RepID=UPI003F8D13F6
MKNDYAEFPQWFARKADDYAYVLTDDGAGRISGFLYLKLEEGPLLDVSPQLPPARRIKVGTLKINAHGTKLGERFIKKIFDHALHEGVGEVYVTVFQHHDGLVRLLARYGFEMRAQKTTQNGVELVLVRVLHVPFTDVVASYPLIPVGAGEAYLLSLQPQWHTRLLPDSILRNESADVVQDVSHTNSIHKVYLAAMDGMQNLRRGDVLLIYRTSDNQGSARFRSVATSICVVEEYRSISSFVSIDDFIKYCLPYSVFTETELREFWRHRRYPHIIRFTYNVALNRRVTRGEMIDEVGLSEGAYWGFMPLTAQQFTNIARRGSIDESLIVHQA